MRSGTSVLDVIWFLISASLGGEWVRCQMATLQRGGGRGKRSVPELFRGKRAKSIKSTFLELAPRLSLLAQGITTICLSS